MLTFYTNRYKKLFDNYFLPSYNRYLLNEIDLIPIYIDQDDSNIKILSDQWREITQKKISYFYNYLITDKDSELVMLSDCDIVFLDKIKDQILLEMGNCDITFQADLNDVNSGFFICKNTYEIREMFKKVLENVKAELSDQDIINMILRKNELKIRFNVLSNLFYNLCKDSKIIKKGRLVNKLFSIDDRYKFIFGGRVAKYPTTKILMFHANYLTSLEDKEEVLENILTIYNQNI